MTDDFLYNNNRWHMVLWKQYSVAVNRLRVEQFRAALNASCEALRPVAIPNKRAMFTSLAAPSAPRPCEAFDVAHIQLSHGLCSFS